MWHDAPDITLQRIFNCRFSTVLKIIHFSVIQNMLIADLDKYSLVQMTILGPKFTRFRTVIIYIFL